MCEYYTDLVLFNIFSSSYVFACSQEIDPFFHYLTQSNFQNATFFPQNLFSQNMAALHWMQQASVSILIAFPEPSFLGFPEHASLCTVGVFRNKAFVFVPILKLLHALQALLTGKL